MKKLARNLFVISLSIILILSFLFTGCAQTPAQPEPSSPPATPRENIPVKPPENQNISSPNTTGIAPTPTGFPIEAKITFTDGVPSLNHTARLVYTVSTRDIPIKNYKATFDLPEGFLLVSGNLTWQGGIAKGEKLEIISAVVKAVKAGNWTIDVTTEIDPGEYKWFFGQNEGPSHSAFYVSVSEDSAQWGLTPPWYKDGGVEVPVHPTNPT